MAQMDQRWRPPALFAFIAKPPQPSLLNSLAILRVLLPASFFPLRMLGCRNRFIITLFTYLESLKLLNGTTASIVATQVALSNAIPEVCTWSVVVRSCGIVIAY
jgi:hypothetical protein